MRKLFLLFILVFGFGSIGSAQLLLVDDFTGLTVGANLAGQSGWTKGGSGPDATIGNSPFLTYSNYNGGGAENVIMPAPVGTSSRVYKALTSNPAPGTNTFYFSFLLRLTATSAASGNYFMSLGDPGTGTTYFARIFAQTSGTGFNLGIGKLTNTATYGPNTYNYNQTYLVVVRYDFVTGSTNDPMYLWVNPVLTAEPATGSAEVSVTSGTDGNPATVGNFHWHNRGALNPVGIFDAVRVAYGANSAAAWTALDAYSSAGTATINVAPAVLTGFSYAAGAGPSTSQTYNLSGSFLSPAAGNLTITPPADYEVSLDNINFFTTAINKSYTGGTLAATPVYVRLKSGLPLGNYNLENIVNSGGTATAVNVTCSGSVIKAEPASHVTAFSAATGTPSYSTINTTWTDATAVTIPDAYLVKGSSVSYAAIVSPVDGTPEADASLVKNIAQGIQAASFTSLIDNTQYYFKIFPYTNSGSFINYKTDGTVPTATATTTLSPSISYTWIGADGAAWNVPANWNPARTSPAVNDILIFNGGGTKTIVSVPAETVGKMSFSGNTIINLQSGAASVLGIYGVTGVDLDIPAGCALNLNAVNAITVSLLTTATASISGSISFSSTASTAHKLLGADAASITFNNGATFTAGLNLSGNVFGTTSLGSVIFANGSTYISQGGSNPFGATQPNSVVVFQTGSLYKVIANASPAFSGRTYANFEMDATGVTLTPTGSSAVSVDNLTITNGTLNFNMTGTPGHSIKGNITVAAGGILNFAPASAGTVSLNGSAAQTISGAGIITTGSVANPGYSTIEIANALGVSMATSIAMNGNLKLTNGLLTLGSSNLVLGPVSAISGTPSATKMVVATGTGQLQKGFASGFTGSFIFPVGDNTVTAEYSPVTLNFSAGTFGTGNFAGVNLVNSKYPDDPNTGNYLKRYWNVSQSGITGFTCNATFQYLTADVNGTESQIYCLKVLPIPFITYNIANTTLHQLTAPGLNSFGTFTGSQPQLPNVTTLPVINITYNSATPGGDVTGDGGSSITARGVCYATTANPSLTGPHTTETGTTGTFTSNLTGLLPQTTYHVRAYATNMVGTTYGNDLTFTTLCEPYPPAIDFYADHINIYVGDSINFFDVSLYCPTFWKWSFVGGEPFQSNDQNPTWIHYNYPGVYTVCLDESNGYGYSSVCKEAYITVTYPPTPTDAKLVITEIMYNPPESGVDTLEFIEVYNNDSVSLNIKDFYFDKGVVYTFPDTTIQPYSYLIVAKSDTAMLNTFGIPVLEWFEGSLNNGGEPIVIYDNEGFIVDSVNYDDSPPWDTLADGWGPSLELCDPNSDNTNPLNWRAAIEFAAINATGDTLWATPMAGCSYPPVADFVASDTAITQYQYVTFTDSSSTDALSWYWTFEGGIPDFFEGKTPPPIQYISMGAFDVSLRVANLAGHNTLVKSEYIEVGPSGIPGITGNQRIQVFPNPNNGIFTLKLDDHQSSLVKILDQLGKVVFEKSVSQQSTILHPSELTPGIYFLRVIRETGDIQSCKLIIH